MKISDVRFIKNHVIDIDITEKCFAKENEGW